MAMRRLNTLRTRKPLGVRLGGYGVLEDVRPRPRPGCEPRLHPRALARPGGDRRGPALRAPGARRRARRAARDRALLAARAARARAARGRPCRPAARRAARLPPGARAARAPPGLALDRSIAALRALAPLDAITAAEHDLGVADERKTAATQVLGQLRQQDDAAKAAEHGAARPGRDRPDRSSTPRRRTPAASRRSSLPARCRSRVPGSAPARRLPGDPGVARPDRRPQGGDRRASSRRSPPPIRRWRPARPRTWRSLRGQQQIGRRRRSSRSPSRSPISSPRSAGATPPSAAAQALLDELRASQPRVSEALRASNVADGLGLRQRWRAGNANAALGRHHDPVRQTRHRAAGARHPRRPRRSTPSCARSTTPSTRSRDLLVAESVHQLVQGNAASGRRDRRRALARRCAAA